MDEKEGVHNFGEGSGSETEHQLVILLGLTVLHDDPVCSDQSDLDEPFDLDLAPLTKGIIA